MIRALFVSAVFLSLAASADLAPLPPPTPVPEPAAPAAAPAQPAVAPAEARPEAAAQPAEADADEPTPADGGPSTTFKAADPSKFKEDLKGVPFMVAAYGAIWAILFVYIVVLVRRTKSLEGEVSALRQDLHRAQGASSPK